MCSHSCVMDLLAYSVGNLLKSGWANGGRYSATTEQASMVTQLRLEQPTTFFRLRKFSYKEQVIFDSNKKNKLRTAHPVQDFSNRYLSIF